MRLGFCSAPEFFTRSAIDCLTSYARRRHVGLFLAVVWWQWRWRNCSIFEDCPWHLQKVMANVLGFFFYDINNYMNYDGEA